MTTMETIRSIRPEAEPLDAEWSALTLQRVTQPSASRRRTPGRASKMAALTAAVFLSTGAAAYAAGMVPAFISREFDWMSPSQVHDQRRVASFEVFTEGGVRTLEVWRAEAASGTTCTLIVEKQARFGRAFDGACAEDPREAWFGWTQESARTLEPMPASTLFVYGEPDDASVTRVRVHGPGFSHSTAVDPDTGGYALAIPEITDDEWTERAGKYVATVDFLDEGGSELDSRILRDR